MTKTALKLKARKRFLDATAGVFLAVSIVLEQSANAAEHGVLLGMLVAADMRCADDAVGQARQRYRLQPDLARSRQGGEEQAFAAEQGGFDVADVFDIEIHFRRQSNHATGIDAQSLTGLQSLFDDGAAGVDEGVAVAAEFLQDKALAAEEAGAEPFLKRDIKRNALGGAQECIFLTQQRAAHLPQVR